MHALSFANDITGYRHAASGATLFDRACRSIELGQFTEGLDDLFNGVEQIRNASGLDAWSAFVDQARTDHRLMSRALTRIRSQNARSTSRAATLATPS